jgi:methionyl-tRNA formyltransferase
MSSTRRVLAAANGSLGATLLDVLARAEVTLAGVLVGPSRAGRPEPCPFVTAWAERHDVPAVHVASWREPEATARLAGLEFDVLLSLAYDLILPEVVLQMARESAVNLHRGIAPDFRGCYSTAWALENGAPTVGATLHLMTGEVDGGPILAQRSLAAKPDMTAAELTPAVESLAIALLEESIGPLLAGKLVAREQQRSGRTFDRRLPPHELDLDALPGLAQRVRALHFPPHPPVHLELGERRFEIREAEPAGALSEIAAGSNFHAFFSVQGALAYGFSLHQGPLVLPACGPAELYGAARASGHELRFFSLDDHLVPEESSLAAALERDALVVLPAPFGQPCCPRALEIARNAAGVVLEDRSAAALSRLPLSGDLAVVALLPWLTTAHERPAIADGALLLSKAPLAPPAWEAPDFAVIGQRLEAAAREAELGRPAAGCHGPRDVASNGREPDGTDLAPRAMSRWSRQELLGRSPLPGTRTLADELARELMHEFGSLCPFTHWPLGTHPHGFPVVLDEAGSPLVRPRNRRVTAARPWVAGAAEGIDLARRLVLLVDGGGQ